MSIPIILNKSSVIIVTKDEYNASIVSIVQLSDELGRWLIDHCYKYIKVEDRDVHTKILDSSGCKIYASFNPKSVRECLKYYHPEIYPISDVRYMTFAQFVDFMNSSGVGKELSKHKTNIDNCGL